MEMMSMNSVVIYATRYGNTRTIAEAIADRLRSYGDVQLFAAEEAPTKLPRRTDLLVIGGPTEMHRMTEPLAEVLQRIEPETLHGVAAATFDTRLRWPRWLAGSAGAGAWNELHYAGARMITPAESFFVKNEEGAEKSKGAKLEPGELERATQWAVSLAEKARSELTVAQQ
jgi:flavodoxin